LAKPTPDTVSNLLVTELWGLGDIAVAMPFLRHASKHAKVTLLAKPHAAPLLRSFAPDVELVPFVAPWTAFRGKYQLHRWPWGEMRATLRILRDQHFTHAISARPDPREHLFLSKTGALERIGFPRAGSGVLLNRALSRPQDPHRVAAWRQLAAHFGWKLTPQVSNESQGRHVIIHTGAAQAVRCWPRERFEQIAAQLRELGWSVSIIDDSHGDLDTLITTLGTADRFIGNDSGPGHIAALLGIPTFTIFGPQLSENFAPQHPNAKWIEGTPCPHKPCFDSCRFDRPHCILDLTTETVSERIVTWLKA
jgi:ADP-heptose:LPS heptosyltransferase